MKHLLYLLPMLVAVGCGKNEYVIHPDGNIIDSVHIEFDSACYTGGVEFITIYDDRFPGWNKDTLYLGERYFIGTDIESSQHNVAVVYWRFSTDGRYETPNRTEYTIQSRVVTIPCW